MATGEHIPQVPRWQGSGRLLFQREGTLASVGLRGYGLQFEDDRNTLRLPGFAVVQLMARQRVRGGLALTFSAENLLGRVFLAGFTPTPVVGAPRLWRAGLRWEGRL